MLTFNKILFHMAWAKRKKMRWSTIKLVSARSTKTEFTNSKLACPQF